MIPLRLELQNFLSYRDLVTLEFDGIHLACISGLNGAGKSSLLDAMTWVLFGKSRSRSDDDLVNRMSAALGETAEVRLEFRLEGTVYRVIRQKQPGRTSVLELQMQDDKALWRTMTEGGVRATQGAIDSLLRMNFDTFINASFFLQGQADEFTTKTPGKRKEILADLLGVNLWDQYKEAAAVRRRGEEERLAVLDARLGEIEMELAEEEARQTALQTAQAELKEIESRLVTQEQLLQQMRRVDAAVQQQKKQVQSLHETLEQAKGRLVRLQSSQSKRQRERDSYQLLLDETEAIVAAHAAWQQAETEFNCWQEKADAFNRLQQQRRPHELAVERTRSRLLQRQKELAGQAERVGAMRQEQEQVALALEEGQKRLEELAAQMDGLAEKENRWREAQTALQALQGERQLQQQQVQQLQRQAERVKQLQSEQPAVEQNRQEAEAEIKRLGEQAVRLAKQREQYALALGDLDRLQAEQPRLREEMEKLRERIERLERETEGECPLCGQGLSESHRLEVLAEVRVGGQNRGDRFRENKLKIQQLEEELPQLEEAIKGGERLERDRQAQQKRLATAQARLEEIARVLAEWQEEEGPARREALEALLADDSALTEQQSRVQKLAEVVGEKKKGEAAEREEQKRVSEARARAAEIERVLAEWEERGQAELAEVESRLAENRIVPEEQEALLVLDDQIMAVEYDPLLHQQTRTTKEQLAPAAQRWQALQQAQAAVKPLETNLADLAQQIEEQNEHVVSLEGQHKEARSQLETLQAGEGDLRTVEQNVLDLRELQVNANRRVGAAQQRLQVLEDRRQQQEQELARRAVITLLIQRLKRLEKACGRDGVQALLIEQALPEIEEDANELLERLTGGDMRVNFETQRELKSRDALAETLDISISDGAGVRPYENYSGGEQFRVNFAIRLALSKVLAKRAGARLQTLVIDEGFGSQDPAGRQRLVEAINVIKDDFERVLVITHIDELKDVFPTRIQVEKRPTGSQIVVI